MSSKQGMRILAFTFAVVALAMSAGAQDIQQIRGIDSRVDYASLTKFGPWDDRNYQLTQEDLRLLAEDEEEIRMAVPAFFRVEMRRAMAENPRSKGSRYLHAAVPIFRQLYGGYLVEGKLYRGTEYREGRYVVLMQDGVDQKEYEAAKFLNGEVRVTSPNGGAESAIKVNPVNTNLVIAGSNGPGSGQKMHFSSNGGDTWSAAAALPLGGTCCDPTVDWSSDGTLAYTATLGNCGAGGCQIWFYRSDDNGQTWNDLPGGTPRRTLNTGSGNDKEFIHVDKFATSPHLDNIYATWHASNIMQFSRSTDFGNTWSTQAFSSATDQRGIGSDITTDKNGDVYYFWPAFNSQRILLRKSTNGGASFGAVTQVDTTEASFTFPVPSMETRDVFVYVSADADLSNGPFGGSVYAAWTDSTGSTSGSASNNHARIQVAYSRNGGSSWTITTPHETADANSVDRYHQWLGVGADGKVHVIFYDTRRSASRTSVDVFYSSSSDGAQTWSTPTRITAQQSPNIADGFEFGDYNGLDIVGNDLIAIFTDNRNEGGGGGDSVDVYAAGIPVSGGGNTAPSVTITSPANGSSFVQGSSVSFAGTATDAEDGSLSASLAWSSSIDGSIGSGASFSTSSLSLGSHTITASVTDSGGLSGSAQIGLTITSPGGGCTDCIDWNVTGTVSYSNQDASGNVTVEDGGDTLFLQQNTWRRTTQTFNVTANTVIEVEFSSTSEGEIHGIGFDENDTLTDNTRIFQLHGTQTWGSAFQNFNNYAGGGAFVTYQIPVGQFYTGSSMFLVLVNDKDSGTLNNTSRFRNVRVFEDVPVGCTVDEDFESGSAGWSNGAGATCSTGDFVLATPTLQSTSGVTTQPSGDHTTGSGDALFTATNSSVGNADVDGGECILESPTWSVSEASNLSVWYFHGQRDNGDDPSGDYFELEVSTNGGASYSSVVSIGDVPSTASWTQTSTAIPAGSSVKLRVRVSDGASTGDIVEGGIDDLQICPSN